MDNNKCLFVNLCQIFESIKTTNCRKTKLNIFKNFLSQIDRRNVYEILRLFLIKLDKQRGPYNLRETSFTKTIKNMLCLAPNGSDLNLLRNFKESNNRNVKDYADAAFTVLRKAVGDSKSNLTVREINVKLNDIAAKTGKDIREQENLIFHLFKALSSVEQKWLIRLLLKDLKLGISKNDMLNAYHKDASKYLVVNSNLQELCRDLLDPDLDYADLQIAQFKAFRPMLSLRCDVRELNKTVVHNREFFIETKFDGERFQLHYSHGEFRYFSRNSFDFTLYFKEHSKSLTFNADSLILDGEMMMWNKNCKKFGSKGLAVDIKKVSKDSVYQQCFCVFDLVYLNGQGLACKPLKERVELLKKVVKEKEGIIHISHLKKGYNKQDILDAINLSMDNQEEGIIFKCPESKYLPDERRGWWKVKLEYFEGVMSDLDVLILGGYYGTGRNKHEITSFLVGVKHDHKNKYLSFAKIGTGLGFKELLVIKEKLSEHWLDITGKEHEHGVYFAKEVPDKWIKPENSCCLQVRGSELTKLFRTNPDYKAEYTLRFPRILKIRPDKPYYSCLTVSDLSKLTQSSQSIEKLNKRHLEISDLLIGSPAKKKLKNQVDAKRKDVQRKSDILASLEFVVLSGLGDWTKEIVENDILENGGKVALDVNENCTFCMLMGDKHLRTETYKGNVDIVKVEWLQRVLDEGEFINYTLFDVIYKSSASEFQFKQNCDKFGDFYTYPATKRSINHILKNKFTGDFAKENYLNLTVKEVRDFYKEIKLRKEYQRCLLGYTAYFDFFKVFNDPTSILISKLDFTEKIDFRLRGGQVSLMLNSECDCIIACPDRFDEVQHYLKTVPCEIPIFASTPLFVDYLARLENS